LGGIPSIILEGIKIPKIIYTGGIGMGENGLTASDVALLNNDGMGGNGWGGMIWLFAILAMMNGGFGFGGGYRPQYATQDFVQNGFNFNDLQD
jgi:hypothetical protein